MKLHTSLAGTGTALKAGANPLHIIRKYLPACNPDAHRDRTAALGYHKDKCNNPECGYEHISFNSCRDRHCPKCNGIRREKWVRLRLGDLLPVKYYHVVFTVPDKLNSLFLAQPVIMYNLLFDCAWKTIQKFALDHKHLGAKTGMVAILHSWGQNLALHRFAMHILPPGFMKIRHYGILSSRNKAVALACALKTLQVVKPGSGYPRQHSALEWPKVIYGKNITLCPKCKTGTMALVAVLYPGCRGSPSEGICKNLLFAS